MAFSKEVIDLCDYLGKIGRHKEAEKIISLAISVESIEINLHELESLVNPEKFEFEDPDLGLIGVERE